MSSYESCQTCGWTKLIFEANLFWNLVNLPCLFYSFARKHDSNDNNVTGDCAIRACVASYLIVELMFGDSRPV